MKAAIYNPYWDSLGGGERYTSTVIKFLLSKNYLVDIYSDKDLTQQVKDRFGIDISAAKFVQGKIDRSYDLVFWVSDGSLPTLLNKKTIIHFQIPFTNVGGKLVKNIVKSRFYVFVSNSRFTKKIVDAEFGINCTVVYPPVETQEFLPGKKSNNILFVGRFSKLTQQKGHQILVDAFSSIYSRAKNWKLLLVGGTGVGTTDSDMKKLQDSIQDKPIEIITDPSYDQIKELYSEAKIYCSPSGYGIDEDKEPARVEHFGISVVEAMASGCVPVVFNAGGHKEIVDESINGFRWNTLSELESILLSLMTDDHKITTLALAAREKSGMFDTANFNSQLDKLI